MRIIKEKRKKRTLISSIYAIAASLSFVLLVNTNTAFASAVADIPLIGKLAEYVKFDKGLSSAIKNDYAQEVNLTAWDKQEKLLLPYVIADEKNLVLFFQLPEDFKQEYNEWINIRLNSMTNKMTGEKINGFSYSTNSLSKDGRDQNYGFIMQDYHFSESSLPRSIEIEVAVNKEIMGNEQDGKTNNVNENQDDSSNSVVEKIGTFIFDIELEEFIEPITYVLNETHTIMAQQVTVKDMKVYPTGTEVTFAFSEDNKAWIKGLELEVEQSDDVFLKGTNGLSGTHDVENKWMKVFIESNYFQKPKEQSLVIKSIRLLNKEEEFITVDLNNKTITPALIDVTLKEVTRHGDNADLVFSTKTTLNDSFSMFSNHYKDAEGNSYEFSSEGTSTIESSLESIITVKYPISGKIILQRSLTPKIILDEPIRIKLP
jgi:hypothetical protein